MITFGANGNLTQRQGRRHDVVKADYGLIKIRSLSFSRMSYHTDNNFMHQSFRNDAILFGHEYNFGFCRHVVVFDSPNWNSSKALPAEKTGRGSLSISSSCPPFLLLLPPPWRLNQSRDRTELNWNSSHWGDTRLSLVRLVSPFPKWFFFFFHYID